MPRFNGGLVDTAGFLGLDGLLTACMPRNFVTLATALVRDRMMLSVRSWCFRNL
jgi:uncharacterized membrane protein YoaK (UPF0700 family)